MQGPRGGRDPFFDFSDLFAGSGGFGPPRSLLSNFFGGRDPFDDPFFTRPFGTMFQSTPFGPSGNPFTPDVHPSGFLEHQAPEPRKPRGPIIEELNSDDEEHQAPEPRKPRGPIIEELNSDDEKEDALEEKKENPRKHGRSNNEPSVEHPDDEPEGKRIRHFQHKSENNRFNGTGPLPQSRSFCFHSSTVTYGGANGTYYTSSRTRRTGSDGVTFEECKEADSATRQAAHIVSRGLHNKGNSLSRKLNSNGKVDTVQTLYNLNEDELAGFEEAWKGKAQKYLPGWTGSIGASTSAPDEQARQGGWALPSTEHNHSVRTMPEVRDKVGSSSSHEWAKTDASDRNAYHQRRRGQK
ncbi:uncharacterized protein LOC133302138 isoform X2 [Gastrolobium bilobum]|nr:uncharacterized protein LOC133302138 isoform X2 [Gastrolobium bilobum]